MFDKQFCAFGEEAVGEDGGGIVRADRFLNLGDDFTIINPSTNAKKSNARYFVSHSDCVGDGGDVPVLW